MTPDQLSPRVRTAVIALASEAVGRMPAAQVPVALRRSASFAPARRAKLVGRQIAETGGRRRGVPPASGTQVRAMVPTVGRGAGGRDDEVAGRRSRPGRGGRLPASAAAGWESWSRPRPTRSAGKRGRSRRTPTAVDRLQRPARAGPRRDAAAAGQAARPARRRSRRTMPHFVVRLGQTRTELKEARAEHWPRSLDAVDDVRREAEVAVREAAAEARRLRARVGRARGRVSASRRRASATTATPR